MGGRAPRIGQDRRVRIVSLLPSATEIVYLLGLDDSLGVTHECDWPPEAKAERLVSYSNIPPAATPSEIRIDAEVISLDPNSRDVLTGITTVAKATGTEQRAHEVVDRLRDRLDAVRRAVAEAPRPRPFALGWGTLPTTPATGCPR